MRRSARRLGAVAAVFLGALLVAEAAAAGARPSSRPAAARGDTLARRLEAVADRAEELAAHFRQMEASVRKSPELQEQAGWASAEEIAWSARLAGLVGSVAERASALGPHLEAASGAGRLVSRGDMEERLDGLRRDLEELTRALESMRGDLEEMQGVVHGGEGHGH